MRCCWSACARSRFSSGVHPQLPAQCGVAQALAQQLEIFRGERERQELTAHEGAHHVQGVRIDSGLGRLGTTHGGGAEDGDRERQD
jgi:hypothetical protein